LENKGGKTKTQVPLRLSAALYNELAAWADSEFRSVNGQIEYLLTECVKWRRHRGRGEPAPAPPVPRD
jgi:hypothetical protein